MNGETVFKATEYYRPFPDPVDVFNDDIERHFEFLLPVGILSLNHLSSNWTGELPIAFPIEPVGGYGLPGQESHPFHNYLCRPNWIGYKLRDNRLNLCCDFRFFHKAFYSENPPRDDIRKRELQNLNSHYEETRTQFALRAKHFCQHGWLTSAPEKWNSEDHDPELFRVSLIDDLGGISFGGNWDNTRDFPISHYPDKFEDRGKIYACDRVLPQTEDGRDFSYIGLVEMWNYIENTNGVLIVFYDPQDQIVLTTIDWS